MKLVAIEDGQPLYEFQPFETLFRYQAEMRDFIDLFWDKNSVE